MSKKHNRKNEQNNQNTNVYAPRYWKPEQEVVLKRMFDLPVTDKKPEQVKTENDIQPTKAFINLVVGMMNRGNAKGAHEKLCLWTSACNVARELVDRFKEHGINGCRIESTLISAVEISFDAQTARIFIKPVEKVIELYGNYSGVTKRYSMYQLSLVVDDVRRLFKEQYDKGYAECAKAIDELSRELRLREIPHYVNYSAKPVADRIVLPWKKGSTTVIFVPGNGKYCYAGSNALLTQYDILNSIVHVYLYEVVRCAK